MKDKRILITGAKGFLGTNLVKRLEGNEIHTLAHDELYSPWLLKVYFTNLQPHIIFHLASYGNHATQTGDAEMFEANIIALRNLLEASLSLPYDAFILAGSSSEYGKKQTPMKEEDVLEPLTMYAATKAAGTMIARGFAKKYDKPIVTVRPFSIYGEQEADHRFIPTAIRCALEGSILPLEPEGAHDWTYCQDFIDGLVTVTEHARTLQGHAVNIGTGVQYSNKQVIAAIAGLIGKPIKTRIIHALRPNDSTVWMANTATLNLLGWKPKHTLVEGLAKTYEFYRRKYSQ